MAIDSRQKRMSAMNPGCPWRGPLVDATESGFSVGNRQAAAYLYSGIASGEAASVTLMPVLLWKAEGEYMHWSTISGRMHWSR